MQQSFDESALGGATAGALNAHPVKGALDDDDRLARLSEQTQLRQRLLHSVRHAAITRPPPVTVEQRLESPRRSRERHLLNGDERR